MDIPILIPAYQPGAEIVDLVAELLRLGAAAIVVVDDGSGAEFEDLFAKLPAAVQVVRHAVNLGKGAALKTGLNHVLTHFPKCSGVVTGDADGQHHPEDILRVADALRNHPDTLILGARAFGTGVPLRSRIGNKATKVLMGLLIGQSVTDTQTGLRGIPATLIPHLLRLRSTGYEFELDMLIACKHQSCPVREEPIQTIYLEGNKSSHFHPLFDSMRIYILLFRFSILSVITAGFDNVIFILVFNATGSIGRSQLTARVVAMMVNYVGARSAVFHSQQRHMAVLPKYVLLVAINGLISYVTIQFLHSRLGYKTIMAKLLAEGLLFIANFAIQRDFVFTRRQSPKTATDWDQYYTSVPATAKLTRKYTTSLLLSTMRKYAVAGERGGLSVIEIGGANSCFLDVIMTQVRPRSYDVVDTNRYGLSLLEPRAAASEVLQLHQQSVLALSLSQKADLVFSVGLVEHFQPEETRKAILAHFDALRPGGLAIITFPTPTLLYRITRRVIEALGMWKFHDERPLRSAEVLAAVEERGDLVFEKILWPLVLTQAMVVARKRECHRARSG